jgi:outer membrane protein assembly factor BamA
VATFTRPRFRSYNWLSAGASVRQRRREWDVPSAAPAGLLIDIPRELGGAVTLGHSSARAYDFSISPQDGFVAAAQLEGRRFTRALPGDEDPAGYFRATGRAQGYRSFSAWGFSRHVLAARVAAGADAGSRAPGYAVGGEGGFGAGSPLGTGINLGDDLDFPVRGYPTGAQFGDRAVAGTAEYRFPLALVERGLGILPLYLDRLWGTAFADGGAAWCVEFCDPVFVGLQSEPHPLYSVGVELGADVTFGYFVRMRLRGGLAVPLSDIDRPGGARERPSPELYFTFGQSF